MDEVTKIKRIRCALLYFHAAQYQYKYSSEYLDKNYDDLKNAYKIDFSKLSNNEAIEYGCAPWEDGLLLIPLYLYYFIKPGQYLFTISGKKILVPDQYTNLIDNDNRGGFLAYGFYPFDHQNCFLKTLT